MIKSKGFSLIEVLFALFIISVGVLGISLMQSKTISYIDSIYKRNQAISLAQELIDIVTIYSSNSNSGIYIKGQNILNDKSCIIKELGKDFSSCRSFDSLDKSFKGWQEKLFKIYGNKYKEMAKKGVRILRADNQSQYIDKGNSNILSIYICYDGGFLNKGDVFKACALNNYEVKASIISLEDI